ncbi:hypothetical protein [Actinoplanes philippinensis]|uniref:hypothetical protein n=1 Tax=Actinoplanes philippinensis TaxID=35752 RepID=UPI0033FC279D
MDKRITKSTRSGKPAKDSVGKPAKAAGGKRAKRSKPTDSTTGDGKAGKHRRDRPADI